MGCIFSNSITPVNGTRFDIIHRYNNNIVNSNQSSTNHIYFKNNQVTSGTGIYPYVHIESSVSEDKLNVQVNDNTVGRFSIDIGNSTSPVSDYLFNVDISRNQLLGHNALHSPCSNWIFNDNGIDASGMFDYLSVTNT